MGWKGRRPAMLLAVVAAALAGPAAHQVAAATRIGMPNPSFTGIGVSGMPLGWEIGYETSLANMSAARDTVTWRTSPASLRVQSTAAGSTDGAAIALMPASRLTQPFKVRLWGRALSGGLTVAVELFPRNPDGSVAEWGPKTELGRIRTGDWTEYVFDCTFVLPASQIGMATMLIWPAAPNTRAWVDDIYLELPTAVLLQDAPEQRSRSGAARPPVPAVVILNGRSVASSASDPLAPSGFAAGVGCLIRVCRPCR